VVLLPSLSLVRQTLHEWLKETAWPDLTYLCVCSDSSVSRGVDSVNMQQSELDFSVTTHADDIRQFLATGFQGVRIVFSTYQSAHLLGASMQGHEPFDLGIFDEAHKTTGRQGAKFSFALSDDNLAIRKRLFLTATPRHYNINKKNKEGDVALVYSMDAADVYGPVIFTLSFARAAELGIICDYKVVISIVTSEMLGRKLIQRSEVLVDGDTVKAQQVANQIAISQAVEKYGVNRIFSFHASVASARSFTSEGGEGIGSHLPGFDAFHVNGAMPTSKRAHMMKAFSEAERAVISNARCLTEGVDVPAVDMVAFMSPKKSKVDIVQATGRAMRKAPGKEVGYVLIPLFLEMENEESVEEALERTGLEDIWNVLQAMQEQDEALVDIIRQMREDKGRTGGFNDARLREKIETLGPELSLESLQNSISAACVDRLGVTWDERFGELEHYKQKFGDCNVPQQWKSKKVHLGIWVGSQRSLYKEGSLDKNRIAKLNYIGFVWDQIEHDWNEMYDLLIKYKDAYDDCNVPLRWKNEGRKLGTWVSGQRYAYKNENLTGSRINLLNEIGFVWNQKDNDWNEMFAALVKYKKENGDCNVSSVTPKTKALGMWIQRQRNYSQKGKLNKEREASLNSIGFIWDSREYIWNKMYSLLAEYQASFGDCNIPKKWDANPQLGTWVLHQRLEYRKGKLSTEKILQLESIRFTWEPFSNKWDSMFCELAAYTHEYGSCNVPTTWKGHNNLGSWVNTQRNKWRSSNLSDEQVKKLIDIGFVFELPSAWREQYENLRLYVKNYGDCNVPTNSEKHSTLANWIRNQRTNRKNGSLGQDHINKLNELGFVWNVLEDMWAIRFAELVEYKNEYGDCLVPSSWNNNPALGRWVSTQRKEYKNNRLSNDHFRKLEALGFGWDPNELIWNQMFALLTDFQMANGHCDVKKSYNKSLGAWVGNQSRAFKTGRLNQSRISKLESIGFEW